MTDHTNDDFADEGILPRERESALNAALHLHRAGGESVVNERDVTTLLADADKIARYLNSGALPA